MSDDAQKTYDAAADNARRAYAEDMACVNKARIAADKAFCEAIDRALAARRKANEDKK